MRRLWSKLSKAVLRSRNTILKWPRLWTLIAQSWQDEIGCVTFHCLSRNPCWNSDKILFALRCLRIWLSKICLITMEQRYVWEIDLQFTGSDFNPFLEIPVTMTCFHCIGTIPVVYDWISKKVSAGANSCSIVLSSLEGSSSSEYAFLNSGINIVLVHLLYLYWDRVYVDTFIAHFQEHWYLFHGYSLKNTVPSISLLFLYMTIWLSFWTRGLWSIREIPLKNNHCDIFNYQNTACIDSREINAFTYVIHLEYIYYFLNKSMC